MADDGLCCPRKLLMKGIGPSGANGARQRLSIQERGTCPRDHRNPDPRKRNAPRRHPRPQSTKMTTLIRTETAIATTALPARLTTRRSTGRSAPVLVLLKLIGRELERPGLARVLLPRVWRRRLNIRALVPLRLLLYSPAHSRSRAAKNAALVRKPRWRRRTPRR